MSERLIELSKSRIVRSSVAAAALGSAFVASIRASSESCAASDLPNQPANVVFDRSLRSPNLELPPTTAIIKNQNTPKLENDKSRFDFGDLTEDQKIALTSFLFAALAGWTAIASRQTNGATKDQLAALTVSELALLTAVAYMLKDMWS